VTPILHIVDPDNIKKDLADPVMQGLMSQGYTVGPAMLWQNAQGESPKLALIMVPATGSPATLQRYADEDERKKRWERLCTAWGAAILASAIVTMACALSAFFA
jgi:hypothetical protein